jgi:hypothetical protein
LRYMMKYNKIIRLLGASSALLVASCTSGGSKSAAGESDVTAPTTVQERIFFDAMSQIPAEGADKEFVIRLHNSYSSQFSLQSVAVIDPLTNKVATNLATVKSAMCSLVPANNSCSLNLTPHLQKSGSFILQAKLTDNKGELHTVKQLIRLSDKIAASNGILFDNDLTTVSAPDGVYHLAFPVMLDEQFDELKASNGSVLCSGGFNPGSNCTYFVDGKSLADNTLVETKLEGYRAGNLVARSSYTTRATSASLANLLISQPADINIGESQNSGSSVVTLFNNGNLEASSVLPFATSNNNNLSVTNSDCTIGTLVPGASCNFTVQAQSEVNGTGSVGASYSSANDKSNVSTNIVYSKANIPAKLELSSVGGSLSNSFVGIPANEFLVISNSGTRNLKAIRYGIDQQQEFVLSSAASGSIAGCAASGSLELAPSQRCALKVVYTPKAATGTAMNYKLSVVGNYTNSNNLDGSVVSDLTRPYSALAMANVLSLSANSLNMIVQTSKTDSRELTVTNTSPFDVTLGTLALTSAVDGLGITTGSTCLANNQLLNSGGGNCGIKVTYAPKSVATETKTKLSIPVAKVGTTSQSNTMREADITVRGVTTLAAATIKVTIKHIDPLPSGISVIGNNSYNFLILPGTLLKVIYTFTAQSAGGDAASFNVSSAGLPVAAEIIANESTCPIGATIGALNAGKSCTVVVAGPRKSLVENGLLMAGQLGIKLLYSWQDVSAEGRIQVQKDETTLHTFNITTDWLDNLRIFSIGKFTESVTANGTVSTVTVRTVFSGLLPNTGVQYPLTVSAFIPGNLRKSTCVINNAASTECSNTLDIPTTAPAGDYYVDVEVADNTLAPNTRIYRRSVKVTNPNPVVDSSGKAFPISETINLTKASAASSAEVLSKKFLATNSGIEYGGFILAAWSEATALTPLSELTWDSNAQSQINVYVTNINNGNIEKLLVKGFRNIVCKRADWSLNTGVFCTGYTGASAKLEVLDSDNDTLPAGRYKGNFELIFKGWGQAYVYEERLKVNVDFEKK